MSSETPQQNNTLGIITPLLDEYSQWFNDILRFIFYSGSEVNEPEARIQKIFTDWFQSISKEYEFEQESLSKLSATHNDLMLINEELIAAVRQGKGLPTLPQFDNFSNLYEQFIIQLRRLERDSVLKDSGIDILTGLRSVSAMHRDLDQEMERLARRGKPFCIALAKIDRFDDIVKQNGIEVGKKYTKAIADLIKKSLRTFDDAYRIGPNEFVLSLKQADKLGGRSALDRLKKLLEKERIAVALNAIQQPLTMSCCIAEPVANDNLEDMLENLRHDLSKVQSHVDTVLEYHEVSPLQRFLGTND